MFNMKTDFNRIKHEQSQLIYFICDKLKIGKKEEIKVVYKKEIESNKYLPKDIDFYKSEYASEI